jgi:hypothetical protein
VSTLPTFVCVPQLPFREKSWFSVVRVKVSSFLPLHFLHHLNQGEKRKKKERCPCSKTQQQQHSHARKRFGKICSLLRSCFLTRKSESILYCLASAAAVVSLVDQARSGGGKGDGELCSFTGR